MIPTYINTTSPHLLRVPPSTLFHACQYVHVTTTNNQVIPLQIQPDPNVPTGTVSLPRWTRKHLKCVDSLQLVPIIAPPTTTTDPTTESTKIAETSTPGKQNSYPPTDPPQTTIDTMLELTLPQNGVLWDGIPSKVDSQCKTILHKLYGLPVCVGCQVAARHLGRVHTFSVTRVATRKTKEDPWTETQQYCRVFPSRINENRCTIIQNR